MKSKYNLVNDEIIALAKDYSTKEVAEYLGVPVSRVRRILKFHVKPPEYVPRYPLKKVEENHIQWVLDIHNGNKTRAARDLGISLRCLRYRINAE